MVISVQQIGFAILAVECDEFTFVKENVADNSQLLTINLGKVQNPNWSSIGTNSCIINSALKVFALKGTYIIITSKKYTIWYIYGRKSSYRKLVLHL